MAGKCPSNRTSTTLPRTETTAPRFAGTLASASIDRLRLAQPRARVSSVGVVDVLDGRFRERRAERRHPFLPFLVADHGQAVDVAEVTHRKLRVLPQRAGRPAVKTGHLEEHAELSVGVYESLELGDKVLVIRRCQRPADVNGTFPPVSALS